MSSRFFVAPRISFVQGRKAFGLCSAIGVVTLTICWFVLGVILATLMAFPSWGSLNVAGVWTVIGQTASRMPNSFFYIFEYVVFFSLVFSLILQVLGLPRFWLTLIGVAIAWAAFSARKLLFEAENWGLIGNHFTLILDLLLSSSLLLSAFACWTATRKFIFGFR